MVLVLAIEAKTFSPQPGRKGFHARVVSFDLERKIDLRAREIVGEIRGQVRATA